MPKTIIACIICFAAFQWAALAAEEPSSVESTEVSAGMADMAAPMESSEAGLESSAPAAESTGAEMESSEAAIESTGEAAAPATTGDPKVDALLANMDRRSKDIKTLTSDITITSQEDIPGGRKSVRTGKLYLRKPNDLYLDLTESGYARKIWITGNSITDYTPDLKSAIKVDMAPGSDGRATVIGLSTTSDELRRQFDMTAEAPSTQHPDSYILTLTPKEGRKFDFTSAGVTLDANSLFPRRIVQKNSDTGITKTYDISNVIENPRVRASMFEPDLARGTSVETYKAGNWKGI